MEMEGFTQDHLDAFFGFAVSELKLPRLRTMLRMFHDWLFLAAWSLSTMTHATSGSSAR